MSRLTIPLGRVFGIPVRLDPSWFLIFVLTTWTLAVSYFPGEFEDWPRVQYWVVGAVTAVLFFASVVLHELGHSVLALRFKIPVRSITLYIFGGVAQIGAEPPSAVAEFWIAIAGPMMSFALSAFFRLLQPTFAAVSPLLALTKYLTYINVSLALFNLIPGFPLDGGRVFRAILWGVTKNLRRATLIAGTLGRIIASLFILGGVWQIFTGKPGNGLWIAFIGWFLDNAATGQMRQQTVTAMLAGHRVSEAMSRSCAIGSADATLQELVDLHILGQGRRCLVIERDDGVAGLLTVHHVREVPRERWGTVTAAQAMTPMEQMKWVPPEAELQKALEEMDRNGVNQLPVIAEGAVLGMLSREDVISYLRTLQELGV
jgi:Zn-dependent protease